MKTIVSVVMPVLNPHPVYFRQAVESILNQTLQDWELVIVEDPSPCSAADLLKDYTDPRIRHIQNQQRTSLSQQLNQGLREAHAELIARQDADDISEPDRLEKQVNFMESHPEIAVIGTWLRVIDEEGRTLGFRRYPCDHNDIVCTMPLYNPIGHPSVMFRREIILKQGGYRYDKFPVEDYDLWCRLAKNGVRFANLSQPLVRYRIHRGGMKSAKLRGVLRGTMDIKRIHFGDEMDFQAKLRLLGERILLLLPPKLVLWLFLRMSVRREP